MTNLVYEESCCCGSKIVVTTEVISMFERRDRVNAFVNKHAKCVEKTESLSDVAARIMSSQPRLITPDAGRPLDSEERARYAMQAYTFPRNQLVYSLSDVEAILRERFPG